jgi:hypothetical protein
MKLGFIVEARARGFNPVKYQGVKKARNLTIPDLKHR